jgi:hypothetical protein
MTIKSLSTVSATTLGDAQLEAVAGGFFDRSYDNHSRNYRDYTDNRVTNTGTRGVASGRDSVIGDRNSTGA